MGSFKEKLSIYSTDANLKQLRIRATIWGLRLFHGMSHRDTKANLQQLQIRNFKWLREKQKKKKITAEKVKFVIAISQTWWKMKSFQDSVGFSGLKSY